MAARPRFSHLGIFVSDLEAMEAFYTGVLGFLATDRGELGETRLVFLSGDPDEHHQIVLAQGRPEDTSFNVINQVSFRLDGLTELKALHARLEREGMSGFRQVTQGMAWSLYFPDPEGNRIECFVDSPW